MKNAATELHTVSIKDKHGLPFKYVQKFLTKCHFTKKLNDKVAYVVLHAP